MEDNKVYFIYLTENKIDGKMYIGQHSCLYEEQFTDGYLGSGILLQRAINKYGKENFERIILEYADSPEELNELESKYVDEEIMNNNKFYNLKTGGKQNNVLSKETRIKIGNANRNPSDETRKKKSMARKGIPLSEEIKRKISESEKGEKSSWFGKHHTEETKEKIKKANTGRYHKEETKEKMKKSWDYSKHFTIETRKKMSDVHKERWKHYAFSDDAKRRMAEAHIGKSPSEETRRKISETLKTKMSGEGNGMFGKHHSEETRRKISEARRAFLKRKQEEIL